MMGFKERTFAPLVAVSLEELVPQEHFYRHVQREESRSSDPVLLPTSISEPRREELAEENTARHDWIVQEGRQQRDVYGSYQRTADCGHQYHRS